MGILYYIQHLRNEAQNDNKNIVIEANGDLGSIIREFNFKLKDENIRVGRDLMVPAGAI